MRHGLFFFLFFVIACCTAHSELQNLSPEAQDQWLRWLLPLPKQVSFEKMVTINPADVGIAARADNGDVEKTAVDEFVHLWHKKTGVAPAGTKFIVTLGIVDARGTLNGRQIPGAERLNSLPNHDQAYVIVPDAEKGLVLAALDEKGLYYAVQTLSQLLEVHLTPERAEIPLVTILDWPDLAERGEWGGNCESEILSMAAVKMNHIETDVVLKVSPEGKGIAEANTNLIELAHRHAVKVVPFITHLDHLGGTGLYKAFPDAEGKGDGALVPRQEGMHAPCASNKDFQRVLTDWMVALAQQQGVDDVCSWLSECEAKCGCDSCQQVGQYALETRCLVNAWRSALKKRPGLRLRILLTQGSYSTNDKVLAECPPEVGVTYYDGGRTYNSSKDPMIYPLLADYAVRGGWLGCYPQLTASWRVVAPWTGPQFIQARMQEFVDKKLHCLSGYATPDNRLYEFNILAAAEWSWNAHGRTPEQFAQVWATRKGFKDAELAAKCAVMIGPLGWDVYGAGVPYPHFFNKAMLTLKAKKPFKWGDGMLRYFPDKKAVDEDIATSAQALEIAKQINSPELIGETLVIQGYLCMLRDLAVVAELQAADQPDVKAMEPVLASLAAAAKQTCDGLHQWDQAANEHHVHSGRFSDTVNVTRNIARETGALLAPLGVKDAAAEIIGYEIGRWARDEFEQQESITKTIDVGDRIKGPGEYNIEFVQGDCVNGLKIHRVALVDATSTAPKEVAVDKHEGEAHSESESTAYVLKLNNFDPAARYSLVANITGVRSSDKRPDLRGCEGVILIRRP